MVLVMRVLLPAASNEATAITLSPGSTAMFSTAQEADLVWPLRLAAPMAPVRALDQRTDVTATLSPAKPVSAYVLLTVRQSPPVMLIVGNVVSAAAALETPAVPAAMAKAATLLKTAVMANLLPRFISTPSIQLIDK